MMTSALAAAAAVATKFSALPALASNHTAPASPSFLFMLADDIGWADFGYNNGTARTPRIDAWARAKGSVLLQDFHSGGTVCSPTRATVLTGLYRLPAQARLLLQLLVEGRHGRPRSH